MTPLPSQLCDAAENNDMAKVRQLLDHDVNVTCADPPGALSTRMRLSPSWRVWSMLFP